MLDKTTTPVEWRARSQRAVGIGFDRKREREVRAQENSGPVERGSSPSYVP